MNRGSILVVDDEPLQREILRDILTDEGYEVYTASNGKAALKIIKEFSPDIVLTDLKMPDMDGIELMESIPKDTEHPILVIIMTAHGTISSAVDAMKKGAFDYLTKPLDRDELLLVVKRAMERIHLLRENLFLKKELMLHSDIGHIIGSSPKMEEIFKIVKKIAPSNTVVLILGESGTGKELIARAIHYNSPRRMKPFMAINCAAIPENLLESELFGYEPGAFTGATTRKMGLFEVADKGTIFLDEIAEMSIQMQSKLLRVLQEKEIRRVGGSKNIKVDVRIIAATNKNLEEEMKKGNFREDLYYRLNVITIHLPPLRERKEDMPDLAKFFIAKANEEFGKRVKGIKDDAMKLLLSYDWPGNVRQFQSAIERAVLLGEEDFITVEDLPEEIRRPSISVGGINIEIPDSGINFEALEKELISKAMEKSNGVVAKAAKLL
ncbi:MAG: sigma-54-dependent Fis family transcriptional regulator, partial [Nitrospirae bacterium]